MEDTMAHSEAEYDAVQLVTPEQVMEATLDMLAGSMTPMELGNPRKDCTALSEAIWLATESDKDWPMYLEDEARDAALEGVSPKKFAEDHFALFAPEARQAAAETLEDLFEQYREEEATRDPTPWEACGVEPGTVEAKERRQ